MRRCVQIPVLLPLLNGVSSVRIFLPNDVRSPKARATVWDRVKEVLRRFSGSLPLLDPIEDMGVSDQRFTELVGKAASLQARLVANPLHKSPDRDDLFQQYSGKVCATVCDGDVLDVALTPGPLMQMELMAEAKHLRKELRATKNLLMKDQLKRMKRVLRRLGHTNAENVVQLKVIATCPLSSPLSWCAHSCVHQGRVAAEINTADELLTTELIFNGVFNDLNPAQSVRASRMQHKPAATVTWTLTGIALIQAALLSCLVFSEKGAEGSDEGLPDHLATPLRQMQAAARRVATVMQECKIQVDTEECVCDAAVGCVVVQLA